MTGYIDFAMTPIEEAGWLSLMRAGVRVQDGNDHARTRDVWAQALADAGAAVPALVAQVERQRAEMQAYRPCVWCARPTTTAFSFDVDLPLLGACDYIHLQTWLLMETSRTQRHPCEQGA